MFDVVVRGTPEVGAKSSAWCDMLIDTPGGGAVPLRDVADVTSRRRRTGHARSGLAADRRTLNRRAAPGAQSPRDVEAAIDETRSRKATTPRSSASTRSCNRGGSGSWSPA